MPKMRREILPPQEGRMRFMRLRQDLEKRGLRHSQAKERVKMEKEFSVILLTNSGDFMLEDQEQLTRKDKGVEAEVPFVINEEEEAQEIQAEKIFIPYSSLDNIQYGSFDQEVA